jgi:hypothetical protein
MQKPIARSGRAWWPGGRTRANASRSTAWIARPAARSAASSVVGEAGVSASSQVSASIASSASMYAAEWQRAISSRWACRVSSAGDSASTSASIR